MSQFHRFTNILLLSVKSKDRAQQTFYLDLNQEDKKFRIQAYTESVIVQDLRALRLVQNFSLNFQANTSGSKLVAKTNGDLTLLST